MAWMPRPWSAGPRQGQRCPRPPPGPRRPPGGGRALPRDRNRRLSARRRGQARHDRPPRHALSRGVPAPGSGRADRRVHQQPLRPPGRSGRCRFKALRGHDPEAPHVLILSLAVAPDLQRAGHGGALPGAFLEQMRGRGKRSAHLICQAALIPFHARAGFRHDGPSASRHGGLSWHAMARALERPPCPGRALPAPARARPAARRAGPALERPAQWRPLSGPAHWPRLARLTGPAHGRRRTRPRSSGPAHWPRFIRRRRRPWPGAASLRSPVA